MELTGDYKKTDLGVLPKEWEIVSANTACALIVDCKNRTPPVISNDEFAVVRTPNVRDGKFIRDELRFTDENSFRKWTARAVPQIGDILITREAPLGEVCLVPKNLRVCLGQRMMLYRPDTNKTDSAFFLYALMSKAVKANLLKKIGGSTVGHAKVNDIRFLELPFPAISEQRAIAAVLSDVDALIESLEKLITKKRDLKQAAIQELLTKKKRLPSFNGDWKLRLLGDLATFHKGRGLPKSELDPYGFNPCIHYGELFTKHPETIRQVLSRTTAQVGAFYSLANDVLMPTSDVTPNGLATASCIQQNQVVLGGDILVIRSNRSELNGSFLSYMIRFLRAQVMKLVTGTTVYHLYGSDIRKFTFLMPDISEQNAIVIALDEITAEISALEQRRDKTCDLKHGMMHELLTGKTRLV